MSATWVGSSLELPASLWLLATVNNCIIAMRLWQNV